MDQQIVYQNCTNIKEEHYQNTDKHFSNAGSCAEAWSSGKFQLETNSDQYEPVRTNSDQSN